MCFAIMASFYCYYVVVRLVFRSERSTPATASYRESCLIQWIVSLPGVLIDTWGRSPKLLIVYLVSLRSTIKRFRCVVGVVLFVRLG